jgi:hypothetical protein
VDMRAASFSHDGNFLLYHDLDMKTGCDLWVRRWDRDPSKITPVKPICFANAGAVGMGRFSHDSRWIAYTSNESSNPEVYVRLFDGSSRTGSPPRSGKWLISRGGGQYPRWRGDGRELLMSVEISSGPEFQAASPKALFRPSSAGIDWDVTADGKRFLFPISPAGNKTEEFTVVLNRETGLRSEPRRRQSLLIV